MMCQILLGSHLIMISLPKSNSFQANCSPAKSVPPQQACSLSQAPAAALALPPVAEPAEYHVQLYLMIVSDGFAFINC